MIVLAEDPGKGDVGEDKAEQATVIPVLGIESMSIGGRGLGYADGKTIFVEGSVPGDQVRVCLSRVRKNWAEGSVQTLLSPSELRQPSPCRYSRICGGCQWDEIPVPQQLSWKTGFLRDAFRKMASVQLPEELSVTASELAWGYRNRALMRAAVCREGRVQVGFFRRSSRERIQIHECLLVHPEISRVLERLNTLRLARRTPLTFRIELQFFPLLKSAQKASVSALIYPVCKSRGRHQESQEDFRELEELISRFPEIAWVGLSLNRKQKPILPLEESEGVTFFTSPGSFFQVNLGQNHRLRARVRSALHEYGGSASSVLDLFCGSGNLALTVAADVASVTGVESNPEAIRIANHAARVQQLSGLTFLAQDSRAFLRSCRRSGQRFSTVIADPPRAGMKDCLPDLIAMGPELLIYVSCDPVTQARDAATLGEFYELVHLEAFDFFPQTAHIESLAVFRKR